MQREQAYRSGLSFPGKKIEWKLTDSWGCPIPADMLYVPYYGRQCERCGMRLTCNGCSKCGKCS